MRHQALILNRGRKRLRTFGLPIAASRVCVLCSYDRRGSSDRDRVEDLDPAEFSQNAGEAEVPAAVFPETSPSARSQGPGKRIDRGCQWRITEITRQ